MARPTFFPQNLKTIRDILEYTQEAIAGYYEIPRQTYRTYEAGVRAPSVYTVLDISDKTGFTVEQLCNQAIPSDTQTIKTLHHRQVQLLKDR